MSSLDPAASFAASPAPVGKRVAAPASAPRSTSFTAADSKPARSAGSGSGGLAQPAAHQHSTAFRPGMRVWIRNPYRRGDERYRAAWLPERLSGRPLFVPAEVRSLAGSQHGQTQLSVQTSLPPRAPLVVAAEDALPMNAVTSLAEVADFAHLHDAALLYSTLRRCVDERIFTRAGPLLLAVNPLAYVADADGVAVLDAPYAERYAAVPPSSAVNALPPAKAKGFRNPPHIFGAAEAAVRALAKSHMHLSQAVAFHGLARSGKSEAAKHALQYLLRRPLVLADVDARRRRAEATPLTTGLRAALGSDSASADTRRRRSIRRSGLLSPRQALCLALASQAAAAAPSASDADPAAAGVAAPLKSPSGRVVLPATSLSRRGAALRPVPPPSSSEVAEAAEECGRRVVFMAAAAATVGRHSDAFPAHAGPVVDDDGADGTGGAFAGAGRDPKDALAGPPLPLPLGTRGNPFIGLGLWDADLGWSVVPVGARVDSVLVDRTPAIAGGLGLVAGAPASASLVSPADRLSAVCPRPGFTALHRLVEGAPEPLRSALRLDAHAGVAAVRGALPFLPPQALAAAEAHVAATRRGPSPSAAAGAKAAAQAAAAAHAAALPGCGFRYLSPLRLDGRPWTHAAWARASRVAAEDDTAEFIALCRSLRLGAGLDSDALASFWHAMAGIMHIGNIRFRPRDAAAARAAAAAASAAAAAPAVQPADTPGAAKRAGSPPSGGRGSATGATGDAAAAASAAGGVLAWGLSVDAPPRRLQSFPGGPSMLVADPALSQAEAEHMADNAALADAKAAVEAAAALRQAEDASASDAERAATAASGAALQAAAACLGTTTWELAATLADIASGRSCDLGVSAPGQQGGRAASPPKRAAAAGSPGGPAGGAAAGLAPPVTGLIFAGADEGVAALTGRPSTAEAVDMGSRRYYSANVDAAVAAAYEALHAWVVSQVNAAAVAAAGELATRARDSSLRRSGRPAPHPATSSASDAGGTRRGGRADSGAAECLAASADELEAAGVPFVALVDSPGPEGFATSRAGEEDGDWNEAPPRASEQEAPLSVIGPAPAALGRLLSNAAAERSHAAMLAAVFTAEERLYQSEGIEFRSVAPAGNDEAAELCEGRRAGALPLLEDAARRASAAAQRGRAAAALSRSLSATSMGGAAGLASSVSAAEAVAAVSPQGGAAGYGTATEDKAVLGKLHGVGRRFETAYCPLETAALASAAALSAKPLLTPAASPRASVARSAPDDSPVSSALATAGSSSRASAVAAASGAWPTDRFPVSDAERRAAQTALVAAHGIDDPEVLGSPALAVSPATHFAVRHTGAICAYDTRGLAAANATGGAERLLLGLLATASACSVATDAAAGFVRMHSEGAAPLAFAGHGSFGPGADGSGASEALVPRHGAPLVPLSQRVREAVADVIEPLLASLPPTGADPGHGGDADDLAFQAGTPALSGPVRPRFVICLRPNARHVPRYVDPALLHKQLASHCVLQAVATRHAGFDHRLAYAAFFARFVVLAPPGSGQELRFPPPPGTPLRQLCRRLLVLVMRHPVFEGVEARAAVQFGVARIFVKPHLWQALETLREHRLQLMDRLAEGTQRLWRQHRSRRRRAELAHGLERLQASWRCLLMRSLWRRRRHCVVLIQHRWRGYRLYRLFVKMREALVKLQAWARGIAARSRLVRYRAALLRLHTLCRGFVVRTHVTAMLECQVAREREAIALTLTASDAVLLRRARGLAVAATGSMAGGRRRGGGAATAALSRSPGDKSGTPRAAGSGGYSGKARTAARDAAGGGGAFRPSALGTPPGPSSFEQGLITTGYLSDTGAATGMARHRGTGAGLAVLAAGGGGAVPALVASGRCYNAQAALTAAAIEAASVAQALALADAQAATAAASAPDRDPRSASSSASSSPAHRGLRRAASGTSAFAEAAPAASTPTGAARGPAAAARASPGSPRRVPHQRLIAALLRMPSATLPSSSAAFSPSTAGSPSGGNRGVLASPRSPDAASLAMVSSSGNGRLWRSPGAAAASRDRGGLALSGGAAPSSPTAPPMRRGNSAGASAAVTAAAVMAATSVNPADGAALAGDVVMTVPLDCQPLNDNGMQAGPYPDGWVAAASALDCQLDAGCGVDLRFLPPPARGVARAASSRPGSPSAYTRLLTRDGRLSAPSVPGAVPVSPVRPSDVLDDLPLPVTAALSLEPDRLTRALVPQELEALAAHGVGSPVGGPSGASGPRRSVLAALLNLPAGHSVAAALGAGRRERVDAIAVGSAHTVALTDAGRVYTWGFSARGQCGHGSESAEPGPRLVEALLFEPAVPEELMSPSAAAAASRRRARERQLEAKRAARAALPRDATPEQVAAADAEAAASVAMATASAVRRAPSSGVGGLPLRVVGIASGEDHTLALTEHGAVFSWGSSRRGQLGIGVWSHATVPVLVEGLPRVAQVAAGARHSVALTASGVVFTWGAGPCLGRSAAPTAPDCVGARFSDDESAPDSCRPAPVGGDLSRQRARLVSCGAEFTAATTHAGDVFTWGRGERGQLGLGAAHATTPLLYPRSVMEGRRGGQDRHSRIVACVCGTHHCIAVSSTGRVAAWGANDFGQLGLGDARDRRSPAALRSLAQRRVVQAAAGARATYALTDFGEVLAWGATAALRPSTLPAVEAVGAGSADPAVEAFGGTMLPLRQLRDMPDDHYLAVAERLDARARLADRHRPASSSTDPAVGGGPAASARSQPAPLAVIIAAAEAAAMDAGISAVSVAAAAAAKERLPMAAGRQNAFGHTADLAAEAPTATSSAVTSPEHARLGQSGLLGASARSPAARAAAAATAGASGDAAASSSALAATGTPVPPHPTPIARDQRAALSQPGREPNTASRLSHAARAVVPQSLRLFRHGRPP
ncbi:hypothetical protein FNF28_05898 [Cafeteria roenbergensis]|uniref:Myosin motor domain-containing protein n=1 Tax=Cafeteria roenbergensis TaxID=33653 RepID=A0A5A8D520_CAFRO|nr:hypothetical protein FNF28_05898 [Cafeteria roenbergensis]